MCVYVHSTFYKIHTADQLHKLPSTPAECCSPARGVQGRPCSWLLMRCLLRYQTGTAPSLRGTRYSMAKARLSVTWTKAVQPLGPGL